MDPIAILRKRLESDSLRSVARQLDISAAYLSDIMANKRKPGPKVLTALGLERKVERVISYRRKTSKKRGNGK